MPLCVGVDFDNTIVCYDELFHRVAREQGLIPSELPRTKRTVRNHLRTAGREDEWTRLQGDVYGARMADAPPFPGVLDFFAQMARQRITVHIVSQKTRYPYAGPRHDLHAAARDWLERQGFFDRDRGGLDRDRVSFEVGQAEKIGRIATLGCSHFIDDLPEILSDPGFPPGVVRILYDPNPSTTEQGSWRRLRSWVEITATVLGDR